MFAVLDLKCSSVLLIPKELGRVDMSIIAEFSQCIWSDRGFCGKYYLSARSSPAYTCWRTQRTANLQVIRKYHFRKLIEPTDTNLATWRVQWSSDEVLHWILWLFFLIVHSTELKLPNILSTKLGWALFLKLFDQWFKSPSQCCIFLSCLDYRKSFKRSPNNFESIPHPTN